MTWMIPKSYDQTVNCFTQYSHITTMNTHDREDRNLPTRVLHHHPTCSTPVAEGRVCDHFAATLPPHLWKNLSSCGTWPAGRRSWSQGRPEDRTQTTSPVEEPLVVRHLAGRQAGVAGSGDRQFPGRLTAAAGRLGVLVAEPDVQRGHCSQPASQGSETCLTVYTNRDMKHTDTETSYVTMS